ncbi:MAG: uroporphyrinogen decarboxylase family protein [Chloroflexota bacterium]
MNRNRSKPLNHRERMEVCLSGEKPDRTPVALWRHFPVDDQKADRLAAAQLNFQKNYDFDFVKVTPASGYFVYDWGVKDAWSGHPHGTREYTRRVIRKAEEWEQLQVLDPRQGHLGEQLAGVRHLTTALSPDTPVIFTVFNPLSQAKKLVGDDSALFHLREYPDEFKRGLETITESSKRFIEALFEAGVDGIFYAVQHAQASMLTPDEYRQYGRPSDLEVLDSAKPGWLNVLHLHGDDVYFELLADYPVQVINWHDLETAPDLVGGLEKFPGVVCGGMRQEDTVNLGSAESVRAEAQAAIEATGGKRFILGTGCVAPTTTPHGNLIAARLAVEE